ncbi:MAG: iron-sulfur cluster loop [Desulfurobacteriaceae bacterium]
MFHEEKFLQRGLRILNRPYKPITFTGLQEADKLLNDLKNYPHAFVLACLMDRQISAERAWLIPYEVSKEIGSFQFRDLRKLSRRRIRRIFKKKRLHRFNERMADIFFEAIRKIDRDYDGNAANIWSRTKSSATVVRRFLEFEGAGIKIATMAVNILVRDFKIKTIKDLSSIDISPDLQVMRVFERTGLIPKNSKREVAVYRARELNPSYPGVFDYPVWEIGRNWCRSKNPDCNNCILQSYCPRIL